MRVRVRERVCVWLRERNKSFNPEPGAGCLGWCAGWAAAGRTRIRFFFCACAPDSVKRVPIIIYTAEHSADAHKHLSLAAAAAAPS